MTTHNYGKAWNDKEYNAMFDLFQEDDAHASTLDANGAKIV